MDGLSLICLMCLYHRIMQSDLNRQKKKKKKTHILSTLRNKMLSPPVIFTDRSKAVLLLWFIFICYNIYKVCLLHDFVATLRLSALPSALYFVLSKLAL